MKKGLDFAVIHQKTHSDDESLYKSVIRKKKEYETWTIRINNLRLKLEEVEREYIFRIGKLYMKLDHLEKEAIRLFEIGNLMKQGLNFLEAKKRIEEKERNETKQNDKYTRFDDFVEIEKEKDREIISTDMMKKIRKLYRKLVPLYHPDLVNDIDEKRQREEMMKKINKAYALKNLDLLIAIENETALNNSNQNDPSIYRKKLEEYMEAITRLKKTQNKLKKSEWFSWLKKLVKARKEKRDIYADLERKLAEDIMKKEILVEKLRKEYGI